MAVRHPQDASAASGRADGFAALLRESEETSSGESPALPITPNWKFFLRHFPGEWAIAEVEVEELVGDGEDAKVRTVSKTFWLPTLSKHVVRPGVNLNRTLKKDEEPRAAYDHQVVAMMRQGATYLELNDWRTRYPDGRRYRLEAPARDPRTKREGTFFLEACRTPRDKLPNKPLKFDTDRATYNRWRLQLCQLGVINPPSSATIRAKLRPFEREVDRVRAITGLENAEKKRRVSEAEKELKRWTDAEVPAYDPELFARLQPARGA